MGRRNAEDYKHPEVILFKFNSFCCSQQTERACIQIALNQQTKQVEMEREEKVSYLFLCPCSTNVTHKEGVIFLAGENTAPFSPHLMTKMSKPTIIKLFIRIGQEHI